MTKDEYREIDDELRLIHRRIETARKHINDRNYGLALKILLKEFPPVTFHV